MNNFAITCQGYEEIFETGYIRVLKEKYNMEPFVANALLELHTLLELHDYGWPKEWMEKMDDCQQIEHKEKIDDQYN